jgi:hypothetical protein
MQAFFQTSRSSWRWRARFICDGDENKVEALRILSTRWASEILDRHWDCIEALAGDLVVGFYLPTKEILDVIRRAPSGSALLRERPVLSAFGRTIGYVAECGDKFFAIDIAGKSRGCYSSCSDAMRALPPIGRI